MPKSKTLPNALMKYRISTSKTKVWDCQYAHTLDLAMASPHQFTSI